MKEIEFTEIENGFFFIDYEFVRSFMFVDAKQILLIDTGMGNGLKKKIDEKWGLPIKVIFTHSDGDHTGEAADFETCYMHPSEMALFRTKNNGNQTISPVWEGDVLTVGDYELEVLLLSGHTPGSIGLFDKKKRFLLSGDSIQTGPVFMFGDHRSFDAYIASIRKLKAMEEQIDWFYSCHHDLKVPVSILNDLLEGAEKMRKGELEGAYVERFEGKAKEYHYKRAAFYAP